MAMLLCEVLAIESDGVRVRVMNSELEILVAAKHDEILGGDVADSELTAFDPAESVEDKISRALRAAEPRIIANAIANFTDSTRMTVTEYLMTKAQLSNEPLKLGGLCLTPSK